MAIANWKNQTVWVGDNLPIMRGMNSESVDLIYLDPPFNSNANYAAPIGSKAAGASFKDMWSLSDVDDEWVNLIEKKHPALFRVLLAAMTDSDKSYLVYMAARLLEMKRILKPTGSIYLHCDWHVGHYLKLVMDAIFGKSNFRNEIVWAYRGGGVPKKDFPKRHDTIFRYSLDPIFNVDPIRIPYSADSQSRLRYTARAFRKDKTYDNYQPHPLGKVPEDWWPMQPIMPSSKERTGYRTQKPLKLLRRIVLASSDPGDVVFDPFCGCATTCIAAEIENRLWTGIDLSPKAGELIRIRMEKEVGLFYKGEVRIDIPRRSDLGKIPPYNIPSNKKSLYGEQGGDCAGCSTHFESRHLEIDHIISRDKGGTDHLENLQLLCGSCNRIKGNRGMEYLRVKLQIGGRR